MSIDQYSTTPSDNDLSNYFKTGMRPSAVKTAGWDIMADIASYAVALPTAGGTANALTVSNGRPLGSLVAGLTQIVSPASANTGPATFAPDGLTAVSIFAYGGVLAGGELQPAVPAYLKYDGVQWNLLNPAPAGRNFFVDPCCRVAQGGATQALSTTAAYGQVDLVQCSASGTAVSAGTIVQDSGFTVAAAATPYSCKIAGATITGTGKVFFRRWIESRDAAALKNQNVLLSVLVRHDASTSLNAFLSVYTPNSQDSYGGGHTLIATGATVSVNSNADTVVAMAVANMGNCSNGVEVILEIDCGAVTTKDFWATDWQACIKTLAQRCQVGDFENDLDRVQRYFEKSYEYGTAPGTVTNNGEMESCIGSQAANGSDFVIQRFNVKKATAPVCTIYSPNNGAAGKAFQGSSGNVAVTTTPDSSVVVINNNSGSTIVSGARMYYHFTADARL